jgi:hypothetical protein
VIAIKREGCGYAAMWLERPSAGHEIEDEDDDGEDKENMYPATKGVAADESNDPENEENNGDCPKHLSFS